jgi:DNA polymerase-3 subunit delta
MPIITTTQLFYDIKTYNLKSFYFFVGKEAFMIEQAVKRIIKFVLAGKDDDFNLQKFDGNNFDVVQFSNAVEAMPFLIPQKVVLLNDINIEKLTASDFEKLCKSVVDMPIQTTVIITSKSYDVVLNQPKKKPDKNSVKTNSFVKQIESYCDIVEFPLSDNSTLAKFIVSRLAKNGIKITQQNANEIVKRCANSYHIILNELEKIENYMNDGEVTREIINDITITNIEESIFSLAKSILVKNTQKAFEITDNLFYQQIPPISILSTLGMAIVDIYRAKCGAVAGLSYIEIATKLGYKGREFIIQNAINDTKKTSLNQIKICLSFLTRADEKLKSVKVDGKILVQKTITEIIMNL